MKKLFFIALAVLVFSSTQAQSSKKNAVADYQQAIELADQYFAENKLKRNRYNLVKIENLLLYGGSKSFPSSSWKITYKSKNKGADDEYMHKGGMAFIRVDIVTKETTFLGYGE